MQTYQLILNPVDDDLPHWIMHIDAENDKQAFEIARLSVAHDPVLQHPGFRELELRIYGRKLATFTRETRTQFKLFGGMKTDT